MPRESLSFFDEKRNVIKAATEWGFWWQTVHEVHIQVKLPEKTSAKEISVEVKPKRIRCAVKGDVIFEVHVEINYACASLCRKSVKVIKTMSKGEEAQTSLKMEFVNGELPRTVYSDEVVWTLEDGNLCIVLAKSDYSFRDDMWESLLADGKYKPDAWTLHEMRKHLDLERFQIENSGMDFSKAQLSKHYDKLPGWSNDRLDELKAKSEEKKSMDNS